MVQHQERPESCARRSRGCLRFHLQTFRTLVILLLLQYSRQADGTTTSCDASTNTPCSYYWYDYVLYAGRDFARHEVLPVFSDDVVVHKFRQHSHRAWPRWNRYYYLHATTQQQQQPTPYLFDYTPGLEWPLECHDRFYNVRMNGTVVHTDRPILAGEPLFLECAAGEDDRATTWRWEELDHRPIETLVAEGAICLESVRLHTEGQATARRAIPQQTTVAMGKALHMHRTELWDVEQQRYEPIVEYMYGVPDRTDLMVLPNGPIFSSIRCSAASGKTPNVALVWDLEGETPEDLFTKPTPILFARDEWAPWMWLRIDTLRDLEEDEELTIDCGSDWQRGHVRQYPGLFPEAWLRNETTGDVWPEIDLTELGPGQVAAVHMNDGQQLAPFLHRVGLPEGFADAMQEWGETLGLLDFLGRYTNDKTLAKGAEERFRVHNGTWWTRRFGNTWQSNMHYIATDDDESNEQFFHALASAGFDKVLQGIGEHFGLKQLTCFYPSYIVVSHCVNAFMHADSEADKIWNLILPIIQVKDGHPELVLGEDDPGHLHIPYVYEREHGILVGKGGMHGTAPTDYRDGTTNHSHRIVMSVYMGDFSDPAVRKEFIDSWEGTIGRGMKASCQQHSHSCFLLLRPSLSQLLARSIRSCPYTTCSLEER